MLIGTYFLAGIYGVGKSTLGVALSQQLDIPFYSAGDLISQVNGEIYGANKAVANKENNQGILAMQVRSLLEDYEKILLAGHFCIINKCGEVDCLPRDVFEKLQIEKIILLEAEQGRILEHLHNRDAKVYSPAIIEALMLTERKMAHAVADRLGCPMVTHRMTYTSTDISTIEQVLREKLDAL